MKNFFYNFIAVIVIVLCVMACGKDNQDGPTSRLSGKITYNGTNLNVQGSSSAIQLQLYQDGFGKYGPITVYVGQDGTFSAELFDGTYKLVTKNGNGPWVNTRDTTIVNVKGNTNVELKLTPYFLVSNATIQFTNNSVSGTFNIEKVIPTAQVDFVKLILSSTQFVDEQNNIIAVTASGVEGSNTVSSSISGQPAIELNAAHSIYGRISVRAKGADQSIYSDIVKLK